MIFSLKNKKQEVSSHQAYVPHQSEPTLSCPLANLTTSHELPVTIFTTATCNKTWTSSISTSQKMRLCINQSRRILKTSVLLRTSSVLPVQSRASIRQLPPAKMSLSTSSCAVKIPSSQPVFSSNTDAAQATEDLKSLLISEDGDLNGKWRLIETGMGVERSFKFKTFKKTWVGNYFFNLIRQP